jgi:PKD repeat protein
MNNYKKTLVTTLVILMLTAMIVPLVKCDVTGINITAPTSSSPIHILPGGTISITYEVSVDRLDQVIDVQVTFGPATVAETTVNPAVIPQPIGSSPVTRTTNVVLPATVTPGTYDVRVRGRQPATGGWDITVSQVGCVIVDSPTSNVAPTADVGGPYSGYEGSPVSFDGSASSDSDGTITAYSWDFGDSSALGTGVNPSHTYADNGAYSVTLTVTDDDGATGTDSTTATIANVAPTVGAITILPSDVVQVNTLITASASFTDPGTADTHTAGWAWGDGTTSTGTVTGDPGDGSVGTDSHTYTAAGVYTVQLTVTDKDGGTGTSTYMYMVVYDPSAGFATGGGWIDSAAGAYKLDSTLSGKATFGFVSKYLKGATIPTGNTEFQFHAGDLNFKSTSYDWLVVTGGNTAQFKGVGTINGEGSYKFMIWANDGGAKGVDTFRILITDNSDNVVYDNGVQQAISGSIVVHR